MLVDLDTDEVYLGELNPRISGVSSMANVTVGTYADIPLFLVREVSARSLHPESVTTVPRRLPRLAGLTLRPREDAEARLAVQTVNTQFSWGSHNTNT